MPVLTIREGGACAIRSGCKASEISAGQMKKVEVEGKEILIANVGGKLYAIDDRCGHMNMSLAAGMLTGKHVTCPFHGATFDVTTGKAVARPSSSGHHRFQIEDSSVAFWHDAPE